MCVNPDHLEAVTNRENVLRGAGVTAQNARKEFCKYGHEFTPENTRHFGTTHRSCKMCQRRYDHGRKHCETCPLLGWRLRGRIGAKPRCVCMDPTYRHPLEEALDRCEELPYACEPTPTELIGAIRWDGWCMLCGRSGHFHRDDCTANRAVAPRDTING